jgi:hypothetical protein
MRQPASLCQAVFVAACCVAVAVGVPGCAKRNAPATAKRSGMSLELANAFAGEVDRSLSSRPATVQALDVYEVTVPFGAVSRSQEFWKRVNETSVDVATYDLLQKNGFRVGVAPAAEWSYFRAIIERYPAVTKHTAVTGGAEGSLELSMKRGVEYQNLAYLTDDNTLLARTYERCENLLAVSFQPAPRHPGQVRMTMCPLVRSNRKKFEVSVTNEEREYDFVKPERLYDLNLCADIPLDGFLVVAPSTLARFATNLGTLFLVDGRETEQVEHVLLMVPRRTKQQPSTGLD